MGKDKMTLLNIVKRKRCSRRKHKVEFIGWIDDTDVSEHLGGYKNWKKATGWNKYDRLVMRCIYKNKESDGIINANKLKKVKITIQEI
jgi:hypothetical protein